MMMRRRDRSNALLGMLLVVAGVVLLLGTLGIADVDWWRWLPAILIVVGLYQLYLNRLQAWIGPLVVIALGTALLLATTGVMPWSFFGALWPLILVAFGASILLGRGREGVEGDSADRINAIAFLGGTKRRMTTASFRGGDITSFMGGVELDLRDAAVADPPATLNINTMMGGVDLTVPDSWIVDIRITALLGGVEDKRRGRDVAQQGAPQLLLTGMALMGGVNIKS